LTAKLFDGIRTFLGSDTVMPLKDLEIKNLKPPEKPKKLSDGGGLYLYLAPNGLKSFRFDYRFQGKRRTLTFGTYPEISLKEAREKLVESKRTLCVQILTQYFKKRPSLHPKTLKNRRPLELWPENGSSVKKSEKKRIAPVVSWVGSKTTCSLSCQTGQYPSLLLLSFWRSYGKLSPEELPMLPIGASSTQVRSSAMAYPQDEFLTILPQISEGR
jgi:hypothetical protein